MAIYFAWDTREIFVGNALGVKVPYVGGENLTTQQVRALISDEIGQDLTSINALLTSNNVNYIAAMQALSTVQDYNSTLGATVSTEVNNLLATWEENDLGNNYYNKTEVDNAFTTFITNVVDPIDAKFDNIYDKSEIDILIPEVGVSQATFDAHVDVATPYFSIKIYETVETEPGIITFVQGLTTDGIWRVQSSTQGYSLIIKYGTDISRIGASGVTYKFDTEHWVSALHPDVVQKVNDILPVAGNVTLELDDIAETATKVWNSLLPQTNNAVNPLGRTSGEVVGENSLAFGYLSHATALNSTALGYHAMSEATEAIQLGEGLNSAASTFNVWGHKVLDKDTGKIPTARITERFSEDTVTIAVLDLNLFYNVHIIK